MGGLIRLATISMTLLLAQAAAVRADAIDGDWCAADGQRMSIKGASITTPGGKTIEGNDIITTIRWRAPSFRPCCSPLVFR